MRLFIKYIYIMTSYYTVPTYLNMQIIFNFLFLFVLLAQRCGCAAAVKLLNVLMYFGCFLRNLIALKSLLTFLFIIDIL